MEGFFSKKETESISRVGGKPATCVSCGLYKNAKCPRMPVAGEGLRKILIIAERISEEDDYAERLFSDAAGKWFVHKLRGAGIDVWKDCFVTAACLCTTDKIPTYTEVANCRKRILQTIDKYKPQIIIPMGMTALYALIGHRWKKDFGDMTKWRGWVIPDQELRCWVAPFSSHHYLHAKRDQKQEMIVFQLDLARITGINLVNLLTTFRTYVEPEIIVLKDLSVLDDIDYGLTAFDYETTGIKPYTKGHRIACAAIATAEDKVYTFMMPKTKAERAPFLRYLQNEMIGKIAQNMKYEDIWSNVVLRTPVKGWEWDTMLATHMIDNRPGITSLKFQTYVQFGIIDYSSFTDFWFAAVNHKDSNSMNRVLELVETEEGRAQLLEYCALDAVFEYKLAMQQMELMNYNDLPF